MERVRINDILDKLINIYPPEKIAIVNKAYIYTAKVHKGQVRLSGEPYLVHPIAVAKILTDMNMDIPTIVTGLLHDVVEDTHSTIEEIEKLFGKDIAKLVDGVTKISKLNFKSAHRKITENFRKLIIASTNDIRVIIIKLADRLHNMRTLQFMPPEKQIRIAQETLDIYAPLANRLGISWIKSELEDLSLKYLKPSAYEAIKNRIDEFQKEKNKYITEVIKIIERNLKFHKIEGKISGRLKHFYSIYKKMVKRNIDISQIYDILAFRVIVKNVPECYQVLGIIHSLWKPVPGRFKDFIAMPKSNMYQSIHTTVIGPFGDFIEIQIRTEEMHKIAEEGIAAHWLYKENRTKDDESFRVFNWLRQVMELKDDIKDANQFFSTIKTEVLSDSVYVFTPAGELIELPAGSTPIDFAYAIHTAVGNKCVGAKVNGVIVPLKYELQTGDRVEIITSKNGKPNKDWLKYVKTSKARSKIRQFIKQENFDTNITIGKVLLEKEFQKNRLDFDDYKKEIPEVMKSFNFVDEDTFYAAIGYGKISPKQIIHKLIPEEPKDKILKKEIKEESKSQSTGILIDGIANYMISYGRCCNPLPGDDIIGYITRGKGITIHRTDCRNVLNLDPERIIDVSWDKEKIDKRNVKIRIIAADRKGLLVELSNAISNLGFNMTNVHIDTTEDGRAIADFFVEMKSTKDYVNLLNRLNKVKGVINVARGE